MIPFCINQRELGCTRTQARFFNVLYLCAVFAAEHIVIEGNPDRFVRRNPIHRIRIDFFCVRRHQKGALIGVIAARFIPAENQNGILSLLSAVGSINDAVQPVKVKLPCLGIAG